MDEKQEPKLKEREETQEQEEEGEGIGEAKPPSPQTQRLHDAPTTTTTTQEQILLALLEDGKAIEQELQLCRTRSNTTIEAPVPLSGERLSELEKELSKEYFLNCILKDEAARELYMQFLTKRHCAENLMFWCDVEEFARLKDPEAMAKRANEIYIKYLQPTSPYEGQSHSPTSIHPSKQTLYS